MKAFLVRIILVVLLALFGASVLDVAYPAVPVLFPIVLFSVAVSLSLTRGFMRALPAVIAIGLVCDIASLGRLGLLAAFCAGLAYTVSFLSRRFAVEHGLMMHLFAGVIVGAGSLGFLIAAPWLDGNPISGRTLGSVSWVTVPVTFGIGILMFPIISVVLRRVEDWLAYFDSPNAF
ncbi:MAG: hypothetical protein HGA16_03875 [Candidatus Moranbacteria bacterium]|nr:hypothetical protein [Candidatus Moranbacteria bacterium]